MPLSVVWFRRDLRLLDNEAVFKAGQNRQCLYVFVIDPWFFKQAEIGWLRVQFLFESLTSLDKQLQSHGNRLLIVKGESVMALTGLLKSLKTDGYQPQLFYNHDIQVDYGRKRDEAIEQYCEQNAVTLNTNHNYFLLHDENKMHQWWKRYYDYQYEPRLDNPIIPALNNSLRQAILRVPQLNPENLAQDLNLVLPHPRQTLFSGGELAARQAVYGFLKDRVDGYRWKISRPYLAQHGATSLLGPHLAFGTISSRTVFQTAVNYRTKVEDRKPKKAFDIASYLDRLRWRDSFTQRLWFHPELSWQNRFPEFDEVYSIDELNDEKQAYFERWQNGQTGFPLLDAAMIQLKQDGFINFRMRAMAATFLTINCGISWHHGARHFMNCLVDGDIAINHWQWQMQAGITNPLSPTFRMYNPSKNMRDRDPSAAYVHFWLPDTHGQSVDKILQTAQPMLDFAQTRRANGKIIADLRRQVRDRIIEEKGSELSQAQVTSRTVKNYTLYTADRYKRYIK